MWHDVKSETFPISLSCLLNVWTIFRRCLMFLDCGFLCEGHGLYFLLQSKGWDFMHVLECLVFVPLDVSLEMESATHKLTPGLQHETEVPQSPFKLWNCYFDVTGFRFYFINLSNKHGETFFWKWLEGRMHEFLHHKKKQTLYTDFSLINSL